MNLAVSAKTRTVLCRIALIFGIGWAYFALSHHNGLLARSLLDVVCVALSISIFSVGWNTRHISQNPVYAALALSYLVVGSLTLLHALTYLPVHILHEGDRNVSLQLWLAGRYCEALAILASVVMLKGCPSPKTISRLLAVYVATAAFLIYAIMQLRNLPVVWTAEGGATNVYRFAGLFTLSLFLAAVLFLRRHRALFSEQTYHLLLLSVTVSIASEAAFVLAHEASNLLLDLGHFLNLISITLIYMAVVRGALLKPYESIFRELFHERARLEAVLEQMPSGVVIADATSENIVLGNSRAAHIWRVPYFSGNLWFKSCIDERVGQDQLGLDEGGCWPLIRSLRTGEVFKDEEVDFVRGDGTSGTLRLSSAPIRDAQGVTVASVTIFDDVTRQKQMELALRRSEEEQLRFLQVAAHELRNPMAALKGICTILQRRVASGRPFKEIPQLIQREVDRLSTLLNEVLEAFRLQKGHLSMEVDKVDLAKLVTTSLESFIVGYPTDRFHVEGVDEPVCVLGDAARLEDVLRNLIGNAIKYSSKKSPVFITLKAGHGKALLWVRDKGLGIPKDQLERVFSGFFRATNVATGGPSGIGLGLYICRDIVERHAGRIWAESDEGQGSTFYVELPLYEGGESGVALAAATGLEAF